MALTLIYQTLIIVLFLSFSFGPSFFALLNAAIKYGYKPGAIIAFGIFLSDLMVCLLIIFLVHFGATNFFHDEESKRFIGIVAGVLLIVFGAFHFKKQDVITEEAIEIKTPAPILMILKGFFLNTLNPAIWFLWLGNVTIISKTLNYSIVKMIFYFSATLVLVLLVELAKVSGASKLKKVLTAKTMAVFNIITGSLLIIFGLNLIRIHFFK